MQIQLHDTVNVDQQLVIAGWQEHYQQMSPGCFRGTVVHMELNGIDVYEERMNTRIEQHFHAPADSLVFSFDTRDGSLYLLNEDTQNTWVTPENYNEVGVVIGPQYLKQLNTLNLSQLDGLFLTPLVSQQSQVFGRWLSRTLQQLAVTHSSIPEEGLAQQLIDDCLYILDCPSHTPDRASQKHLAHDRHLVQRVFDLVMASPQEHFNVLQLANGVGVSVRQLQQSFTSFTGVSPSQWQRLRRLNFARRDLLRMKPGDTSVAEVAMRCHSAPGPILQAYRNLFGEL
ncbi:helix-turn-helix domain-containing protein, partial [Pseudomonas laurentiana]|nr:helix-turn-helix domain-containing protein [Pseudomonas laurentiana]